MKTSGHRRCLCGRQSRQLGQPAHHHNHSSENNRFESEFKETRSALHFHFSWKNVVLASTTRESNLTALQWTPAHKIEPGGSSRCASCVSFIQKTGKIE